WQPKWAVVAALALAGIFATAVAPAGGVAPAESGRPPPASATADCAKPSSILMPLAGPSGSLSSGSTLSFTYEFEIVHYVAVDATLAVYLPRLFASFPLTNGSVLMLSVAPQRLTVGNGSWTSAAVGTATRAFGGTTNFAPAATAQLSSQLLAVMATTTQYEGLNLSFRWHWATTTPSGSTVSPWAINTVDQGCPSDFWPAPYVDLVRDWGLQGPAGSNFTAALTGFTSHQYFFLELETPTGTVVFSQGETTPTGNATPHNVSIAFDCWCGHLATGPYLVHLHNLMGSLLYSESVTVTARDGMVASASGEPNSGPAPLTVSFNSTVTSGAPPYTYAWVFGDGGTSTLPDPSHMYATGGSYVAVLTATDSVGRSASSRTSISVGTPGSGLTLQASTNVSNGPAPLWVRCSGSAAGGTTPYVYAWTFGDGARGGGAVASHLYVRPGNFTIFLTARDAAGATASSTLTIAVTSELQVRLTSTPPSPHPGDRVSIAANVAGNVSIAGYRWTINQHFVNGSGATLDLGAVAAGTYRIDVIVRDRSGVEGNGTLVLSVANASASGSPTSFALLGAMPPWAWVLVGAGVGAAGLGVTVARSGRRPPRRRSKSGRAAGPHASEP
ncbi:MAG: PKD domain-containing protein, partial [Thermoplasmata archaeon]|nr:PKD domain-containing protein [Thermoplasmata archaeon]